MSKPRKFRNITALRACNVSSSRHYYFSGYCTVHTGGVSTATSARRFRWCPDFGIVDGEPLPRYAVLCFERELLASLERGEITFYEYDQDGNQRTEGLRYFDQEAVEWIIYFLRHDTGRASRS